ncbi:MAG TPA: serine/threonine-protein kinase [Terriglobales bacterium]|nr:serine/threonine-protein kinase [Terriglobales bacterium]
MSSGTGTRVGRYEILAEIGRGAMGIVYQARDPRIDRTVALKTISLSGQDLEEEKEYRERFVLEAQAVGRLSHPGIITIFDAGEDPETHEPFIAMEYVQGQSLHSMLGHRQEKMTLEASLQIAQEIAEALDYAHEQGVVHRDIKPANILITPEGHAKIADFGIAKLNQAQTTLPGEVLGSPAYMAPEQLRGDGVDPRSDLFSAGVILYNMLTGFRPFQGDSATTICYKVVNRKPIFVSAFDASFPPELDRIVSKAIAKNPEERFQSGREMAEAIAELRGRQAGKLNSDFLREVIEEHNLIPVFGQLSVAPDNAGRTAGPTSKKLLEEKPLWAATAAIFLLVLAASAAILWRGKSAPAPSIIFSQTIPAPSLTPPAPVRQPNVAEKAALDIEIEHAFSSANVSIWLDRKLVYRQDLHGQTKRRAFFFKKVEGIESIDLAVPTGEHWIEVQVKSAAAGYDQSKKIIESFSSKGKNVLHVHCNEEKHSLELAL